MSDHKCAMGFDLAKGRDGECPECGARKDQTCGRWVTWAEGRVKDAEAAESSLSKALAWVAELEVEIPKHRERWQRLVNAVAGRFARGLVVGDDDMAVDLAIQRVKQAPDAADMRERAAQKVKKMRVTILPHEFAEPVEQARGQFVAAIRALPLTALQEPGDD